MHPADNRRQRTHLSVQSCQQAALLAVPRSAVNARAAWLAGPRPAAEAVRSLYAICSPTKSNTVAGHGRRASPQGGGYKTTIDWVGLATRSSIFGAVLTGLLLDCLPAYRVKPAYARL